jgi:serine/threonine-protein kinase
MKKNFTISIDFWRFFAIILPAAILIGIAGLVAGFLVVDKFVMPHIIGVANKGVVKVPDIQGFDVERAKQTLYDVGLRLSVDHREYDLSIPRNGVLSQTPPAGEEVKAGRHIIVIVSNGDEVDTVPDVRHLVENAARKICSEKGFFNVIIKRIYDDVVPLDQIVWTEPNGGTITSREIPLVIALSRGARPTHADVPNLVGDMVSEATSKLDEVGLVLGSVSYRSASSAPGTILSQSVSPGSSAPLESSVDIIVATKN